MLQPTANAINFAKVGTDESTPEEDQAALEQLFAMDEGTYTPPEPKDTISKKETPEGNAGEEVIQQTEEEVSEPESETDEDDTGKETETASTEAKNQKNWEEEYKNLKAKHENLQKLQGRQAVELGELRQGREQYEEVRSLINGNPHIAQALLNARTGTPQDQAFPEEEFDPMDPKSVEKLVSKKMAEYDQKRQQAALAEQQRNYQTAVTTRSKLTQDRLIASGVAEDTVVKNMAKLTQDTINGLGPEIAMYWANKDADLAKARKEGRDEAIAELKKKQKTAVRATGTTSSKGIKGTAGKVDITQINSAQASKYIDTLPDGHPDIEKIAKLIAEGKMK